MSGMSQCSTRNVVSKYFLLLDKKKPKIGLYSNYFFVTLFFSQPKHIRMTHTLQKDILFVGSNSSSPARRYVAQNFGGFATVSRRLSKRFKNVPF